MIENKALLLKLQSIIILQFILPISFSYIFVLSLFVYISKLPIIWKLLPF
jgi:hypothetical protein